MALPNILCFINKEQIWCGWLPRLFLTQFWTKLSTHPEVRCAWGQVTSLPADSLSLIFKLYLFVNPFEETGLNPQRIHPRWFTCTVPGSIPSTQSNLTSSGLSRGFDRRPYFSHISSQSFSNAIQQVSIMKGAFTSVLKHIYYSVGVLIKSVY